MATYLRALIEPPDPGIYQNVPDEVYHSWHGISSHRCGAIFDGMTPARMMWESENPSHPTPAKQLGTATHYAVLQPDLLPGRVVVGLDHDRRSKVNKAAWRIFEEEHQSKLILTTTQYDGMERNVDRIMDHPAARRLMTMDGQCELSIVWVDPQTGGTCKARIDKYIPELNALVDIKTTGTTTEKDFARDVFKFGYHRQASHYLDGANRCGLKAEHFILIVLETASPHFVSVRRMTDTAVDAGFHDLRMPKETLAECYKNSIWPAHDEQISKIKLPGWMLRKYAKG